MDKKAFLVEELDIDSLEKIGFKYFEDWSVSGETLMKAYIYRDGVFELWINAETREVVLTSTEQDTSLKHKKIIEILLSLNKHIKFK